MSEAKVVPIHKGVAVHQGEPNPDVVADLENWLEQARSGELVGVAIVGHYRDMSCGNRRAGTVSRSMVGQCFALMQRMTALLEA